uniref:Small ribosomal subunit protein eS1 n=1 Tax=Paramoeba aestuarina TaxID=180227 RepID=A0A7S4NZQ8_9EUKA|mmetsp:Transcript_33697/g.52691  ORF Transcript_33697/g.52691 Transcript_33697/m.52691 type:complete len:251 (+) Transcript_33697:39-791(+)|eukprot:CAMPEP_0201521930 /NCGR_PEP_ID=MMETSP0161_2-20130828/16358_1 /ASSEMBLY_ACC=CAM_ASM_000251 /TAXON_ID=180227 /ORGANISM="Neoparamoeba aestuarina, Strain SoJaBio B1-5/56/2" /LENGTH=250 /DNA_ID=CAMNT_0047920667 /DNA_START=34 /DNA_END=786 /DNA_ORIENTATION=+
MAIGKNKKTTGRKGGKKKASDPMLRKEWYDVIAPATFTNRKAAKTIVNKSSGMKLAVDGLRHRVFHTYLSDLQDQPEHGHVKIKLRVEDIQGRNCLTQFYGMDTSVDKLRSMVRKWISLIECVVDASTTDGYRMRFFVLLFTKPQDKQVCRNSYANASQKKAIRRRATQIIRDSVSKSDVNNVVRKLHTKVMASEIEKSGSQVYPLQNVIIRKVKTIKIPQLITQKLLDAHNHDIPESKEDIGEPITVAE